MQSRVSIEKRFNSARSSLIAITAFTAINMILDLIGANISFLFSASIPSFAMILMDNKYIGVLVALMIVIFFLICWLVSKKTPGIMLAAAIVFALDTFAMVLVVIFTVMDGNFEVGFIMDIVFHAWALASLVSGVIAWTKLKELPPADPNAPAFFYNTNGNPTDPSTNEMYYNPSVQQQYQPPQSYEYPQQTEQSAPTMTVDNPPPMPASQYQAYQAPIDTPPIPYQAPHQDDTTSEEQQ